MHKYQFRVKNNNHTIKRICAIHPLSSWKDGFTRCYWGFKLKQDCTKLQQKGGEKYMSKFLPDGYKTPEVPSNYMDLEVGLNAFRILSSAIVGYEWWVDSGEGHSKPKRVRTADEVPTEVQNETDTQAKARHFWAFTVYNYTTKTIQVLELKQQTIMRVIEAFVNNVKWGDPKKYDIIIEKVKTGPRDRDVEYNVIPEPPTQLDVGIVELAKNIPVNLQALYTGEDPFADTDAEKPSSEKTNGHFTASRHARVHS